VQLLFIVFYYYYRLIQSPYLSHECEYVHKLIDKGKQIFLDEDYARLINRFEVVFDKFTEMSVKISLPVSPKLIKSYKEYRDKFDSLESYSVVSLLDHYKMQKPATEDIIITFENENGDSRACCNEKCTIF
jgi:hypothetical protein